MVWKNNTHVGFGIAKGNDGKYFYIINYFPTVNIDGEFKKNVFQFRTDKKEEISKNILDKTGVKKYVVKKYWKNIK